MAGFAVTIEDNGQGRDEQDRGTRLLTPEADLPLREPGESEGRCGYGLLAGKIDGRFPVLVGEIAGDFELPPNAFDDLEIDLVECGSAWDKVLFEIGGGKFAAGLRVLDDTAWDKAFGGLLIA